MIVGYLPMTADLFHVGHLRAIKRASKMCDHLIIGLLDCSKYKKTIIPYNEREEILWALPWVHEIRRQKSLKMNLKGIDLVFGESFEKEELESIKKYGCKAIKQPYYKKQSTTKIKQTVCSLVTHQI